MKHTGFRFISLISFIIILTIGVLYNYYIITETSDLKIRFILKPIPIIILIIDIIIYFIIYRMHIYALLMQMGFLFCMLGDILLMFYIPKIPKYNNKIFLIVGGTSFFIARVIMSLLFVVYPYKNKIEKCIKTTIKKTVLTAIIPFIYTVFFIIYFAINMKNNIMITLVSFYIIAMGSQFFFSLLRINGFADESFVPQILGVLGTLLFTVSDTILFWNVFIKHIHYGDVISISLYWSGMYILMLSVIRNSNFNIEKNIDPYFLSLN